VAHYLDWVDIILIGWLVVSALITPLVGRWLGGLFHDPAGEDYSSDHEPLPTKVPHDAADV